MLSNSITALDVDPYTYGATTKDLILIEPRQNPDSGFGGPDPFMPLVSFSGWREGLGMFHKFPTCSESRNGVEGERVDELNGRALVIAAGEYAPGMGALSSIQLVPSTAVDSNRLCNGPVWCPLAASPHIKALQT